MHGDFLIVLLLMVVGCAALLFGIVYMFCQFFARIGRGLLGVIAPGRVAGADGWGGRCGRPRVCPNDRCRKVEHRPASYCSQCGTRLV
jgi:hypothetical protein